MQGDSSLVKKMPKKEDKFKKIEINPDSTDLMSEFLDK